LKEQQRSATRKTRRQNQKINNYYDVAAHPKTRRLQTARTKSRQGQVRQVGAEGVRKLGVPGPEERVYSRKVRQAHYNNSGGSEKGGDTEVRLLTSATIL